jgi:hypothetical protein
MKITELISQLKELKIKHGDQMVYIYKYPDDMHFECEKEFIEYKPEFAIDDDIWEHEGIYIG